MKKNAAYILLLLTSLPGFSNPVEGTRAQIELIEAQTSHFQTFSSEHFVFRFAPGKDQILPMYASKALEIAFSRINSDLGTTPDGKIKVEFYPSWKDFIALSTLTEEQVRTTGTIALCKFDRLMVTTPRALFHGYRWLDTVTHEFAHDVINRASRGHAPVWLHEGIAKYEEVRWRKAEGSEISEDSKALLAKRLKSNQLIPFEKLHPSIAKLPNSEAAEVAFAQVFYFVKYLVEQRGGMKSLAHLLKTLGTGKAMSPSLQEVYGSSFAQLDTSWKHWMAKQGLRTSVGTKAKQIKLQTDQDSNSNVELSNIKDAKLRNWVRIGDLLMEEGRAKAAMVEYKQALQGLESPSPFLLNKAALAALESDDRAQALNMLTQAVENFPEYPVSYVRRGALFVKAKQWEAAEKDFLEANALNPFDPEIHRGLREIYFKTGNRALEAEETKVLEWLGVK